MAGDSLLSALQEEWGDEHSLARQPITIASMVQQLKMWLEGATLSHLSDHLRQMKVKVAGAAEATERDMTGELSGELTGLLSVCVEDYREMEELLGDLAQEVAAEDRARVKEDLLHLRAVARSLSDHNQAVEQWRSAAVPRCPRCGDSSANRSWTCPNCQLEMLYPDPVGPRASRTLILGPEFKTVHDAYVAVVKGEKTLSRLLGTLEPLRQLMEDYADLSEAHLTYDRNLSAALDQVSGAARQGLEGLQMLEGVAQTRQTRDLHEGWRLIFEAAGVLLNQTGAVARAAGQEIESGVSSEDGVFLQGDD